MRGERWGLQGWVERAAPVELFVWGAVVWVPVKQRQPAARTYFMNTSGKSMLFSYGNSKQNDAQESGISHKIHCFK